MKSPQTAIVTIDENTSQVVSTKPPRKKRKTKPPTFTDEQRSKSIATRKANGIAARAAAVETFRKLECHVAKTVKALGITRATFLKWLEVDPDFAKSIAEAKEELIDNAEKSLHRQSDLMDFQATKFILTTIGKDRGYIENKGPDTATQINIAWLAPTNQ